MPTEARQPGCDKCTKGDPPTKHYCEDCMVILHKIYERPEAEPQPHSGRRFQVSDRRSRRRRRPQ